MTATAARRRPSPAGPKPPATVHLDMDGAAHIFRAHGWSYPSSEDPLFFSGLRAFLDMFARRGLRATIFVIAEDVNDPAKHELLSEAVRQGHEVASHTVTHEHLTRLDETRRRDEIVRSRELLGERLGANVDGFRAPGFLIDRSALELLDDAGYSWDSSLFPRAGRGADAGRITARSA